MLLKHISLMLCLAFVCTPAFATIIGLNQIATPDIQPTGVLSVLAQGQNGALGNTEQLQLELGVTPRFEVALFRGFEPGETNLNAELAFVQGQHFLLSAGLLGVQNRLQPQPFLEAGWNVGKWYPVAGIQVQDSKLLGVLGVAYQVTPRLSLRTDYVSGPDSFATVGLNAYITPALSFNPAVFITNSSPHRLFGYGVLSWNIKVW
jgi:hypothetical protein